MHKSRARWLCLDCRKDLLPAGGDSYTVRNRLWRQLVPRLARHGMLCLACLQQRLGRDLQPHDFRTRENLLAEPEGVGDEPMSLDDYGILDGLRGPELTVVDKFLMEQASDRPRRMRDLIASALEDPSPEIPSVTDVFYCERIEYLLDIGELSVVEDHPAWMDVTVRKTR